MKKQCNQVKVFTYDGFSKYSVKKEFLDKLQKGNYTGLYMKNVNQFYLFDGQIDIYKIFNLQKSDYETTENIEKPFDMIDTGKAEASFLIF